MNVFARTIVTTLGVSGAVAGMALQPAPEPPRPPEPAPAQEPIRDPRSPSNQPGDTPPADERERGGAGPDARTNREGPGDVSESRHPRLDAREVDAMIAAWDPRAKQAARAMMAKYGEPNEMTSRRLYWYENGPWLWTCVRNEPVMHNWPRAHAGVIEQAVALRVGAERMGEIGNFSGAVTVDRPAGVVMSRSDAEAGNILAINLVQHIASGTRDAESARRECEKLSLSSGEPSPLTERFTFTPAATGSGDLDREVGATGSPSATRPAATPVTPSPLPIERPRVPNEDKKPK